MSTPPSQVGQAGVLAVAIRDTGALYASYLSFVRGGGLFIPTSKSYALGEEVVLLLTLMEETDRVPVSGKVVWITPQGAQGGKVAGVGVQFADDALGHNARDRIEGYLAGLLHTTRNTHTL